MNDPDRLNIRTVCVAVGAVAGNAVSSQSIVNGTFGVFLLPVSTSLGWSRSRFSAVLLILAAVGLLSYALFGRIADRHGARGTLIIGNLIFAAAVALLSLSSTSVAWTYGLFFFVGLAGSIPSTVVMAKIVAEWFVRLRGMVFALTATLGISVGFTAMPLLAQWLISTYGWRGAYVRLAGLILAVGQVTFWFLLRGRTRVVRHAQDSKQARDLAGYSAAEARRSPVFWLVLAAVTLGGSAATGVLAQIVAMAADRGVDANIAVLGISSLAVSNLVFQGILGRLYERLSTPRIAAPMILVMAVGIFLVSNARVPWMFVFGGALMGVGAGADYSFLPYSLQRYFGLKAYGEIYGSAFGINLFICSSGPLLLAASHDVFGSYHTGILVMIAIVVTSAVIMFCLPAYASIRKPTAAVIYPGDRELG
jgi:MFS family permease